MQRHRGRLTDGDVGDPVLCRVAFHCPRCPFVRLKTKRVFAPCADQAAVEAAATAYASPHAFSAKITGSSVRPRGVRLYSTLGGTCA